MPETTYLIQKSLRFYEMTEGNKRIITENEFKKQICREFQLSEKSTALRCGYFMKDVGIYAEEKGERPPVRNVIARLMYIVSEVNSKNP